MNKQDSKITNWTIQHRLCRQLNTQHSKFNIAHSASSAIPRHTNTPEVVVCIYGSPIERFYDKQGNGTEMVFFQILARRKSILNKQMKFTQYIVTCKSDYILSTNN